MALSIGENMGSRGSSSGRSRGISARSVGNHDIGQVDKYASQNRALDSARVYANQILKDYGMTRYDRVQRPDLKEGSAGWELARILADNPDRIGTSAAVARPSRKAVDEARVWLNYDKKITAKRLASAGGVSAEYPDQYNKKTMQDMIMDRSRLQNIDYALNNFIKDRLARKK